MNYSLDQAVCLTGCTRSQLRYWVETKLISVPDSELGASGNGRGAFSFRNLVELRTVKGMLDNGISLQKVRRTLDYLQHNLGHASPLAECRLITDGSSIFKICADSGEVIDTLRQGQFAFAIALGEMAAEIEALCSELKRDRDDFIDQLLVEDGPDNRFRSTPRLDKTRAPRTLLTLSPLLRWQATGLYSGLAKPDGGYNIPTGLNP